MSIKAVALAIVVACCPAAADAVTLRDVIELSRAGVPDAILTALIDADRTVFTLEPAQVLELRNAGVSDEVVLKMIHTRRAVEVTPPAATPSEEAPILLIIGDQPPKPAAPAVVTVVMPYPVIVDVAERRPVVHRRARMPVGSIDVGWLIRNGDFGGFDAGRLPATPDERDHGLSRSRQATESTAALLEAAPRSSDRSASCHPNSR